MIRKIARYVVKEEEIDNVKPVIEGFVSAIKEYESATLYHAYQADDGVTFYHVMAFPDEAADTFICGVAVENVEDWLCLDTQYLSEKLQVPREDLEDSAQRTGRIKRALARLGALGDGPTNVVEGFVREAPPKVFRRWLDDKALQAFYSNCRAAATREDCETPNELETPH